MTRNQPALGPRGGLWPVLLMCVIHKEGLCPSSGDINRLMMMMTRKPVTQYCCLLNSLIAFLTF
jgi:hypothetical protein